MLLGKFLWSQNFSRVSAYLINIMHAIACNCSGETIGEFGFCSFRLFDYFYTRLPRQTFIHFSERIFLKKLSIFMKIWICGEFRDLAHRYNFERLRNSSECQICTMCKVNTGDTMKCPKKHVKKVFCHVMAIAFIFEMPQNRRISIPVIFLSEYLVT